MYYLKGKKIYSANCLQVEEMFFLNATFITQEIRQIKILFVNANKLQKKFL